MYLKMDKFEDKSETNILRYFMIGGLSGIVFMATICKLFTKN